MNNILRIVLLFILILLLTSTYITKIRLDDYKKKEITVYVKGEVEQEKYITLDAYSTISDALEYVTLTSESDLSNINQQIVLKDKDVIVIPKKEEVIKISINTASKEQLMTLKGIGESIATRIIEYRNNYGLFQTIEELKNVKGIGDVLFERIKDLITL